jgi:hypothetical protein
LRAMADDPEDLILRELRRLDQKIDKLDLRLNDMLSAMHRIEAALGAIGGTVAALRHDTSIFAERWADHEVRLLAIEDDTAAN